MSTYPQLIIDFFIHDISLFPSICLFVCLSIHLPHSLPDISPHPLHHSIVHVFIDRDLPLLFVVSSSSLPRFDYSFCVCFPLSLINRLQSLSAASKSPVSPPTPPGTKRASSLFHNMLVTYINAAKNKPILRQPPRSLQTKTYPLMFKDSALFPTEFSKIIGSPIKWNIPETKQMTNKHLFLKD